MRISWFVVFVISLIFFMAGDIFISVSEGASVTFDLESISSSLFIGKTVKPSGALKFFKVLTAMSGSDPVSYADGLHLEAGSGLQRIDAFSDCAQIQNTSGKAVFVPSYKKSEWDSFLANTPGGISRASCGSICVGDESHDETGSVETCAYGCSNGECNECLTDADCSASSNTRCSEESDPNVCVCNASSQKCSGACVNTTIDVNNCGGCGFKCGANQTCSGGTCVCAQVHYQNCNMTNGDGCEVDTRSNSLNCGSCGHSCASGTCSDSACSCAAKLLVDPFGDGVDVSLVPTLSGLSTNGSCTGGSGSSPVYNCFDGDFLHSNGGCNDPT